MFQNSQDFYSSAFSFLERQKQSTPTFIEQLTYVLSVNVLTFHSFPYDEIHSCYQQCNQTNSSIDVPRNSCEKADKTNVKHFCMVFKHLEKCLKNFSHHLTAMILIYIYVKLQKWTMFPAKTTPSYQMLHLMFPIG